MKLGSLYDGSGTAPLCAAILGWEPVWASEIEPFPVKVTSKRFPRMKHLGDITKINGGEIEPVAVIVGGSPCQDLSVAGKQAGLQGGTRSRLFYEMMRIIKEMRRATNGQYPRYIVWENVPGAFSSNKGHDFHEVLKAFCSCADHPCDVPGPPRGGGRAGADKLVWGNAGLIMGDDFSLAWRVLDAQFWGVPQRRRRIFLAVDLGGGRAREMLFEREGLWWKPQQSGEARESAAAATVGGADRGVGIRYLNAINPVAYDCRGNGDGKIVPTLIGDHENRVTDYSVCAVYALEGNTVDRNSAQNGRGYCENISPTLDEQDRHAVAYDVQGFDVFNMSSTGDVAKTLTTISSDADHVPVVYHSMEGFADYQENDVASSLKARDYKDATDLVVCKGKPPRKYIVRRLTPLECCRLQGFPDWWVYGCEAKPVSSWWTDNDVWMRVIDPHGEVPGSDSAIYKMWGNGMALPCMLYVLSGMEEENEQGNLDR